MYSDGLGYQRSRSISARRDSESRYDRNRHIYDIFELHAHSDKRQPEQLLADLHTYSARNGHTQYYRLISGQRATFWKYGIAVPANRQ